VVCGLPGHLPLQRAVYMGILLGTETAKRYLHCVFLNVLISLDADP